MAASAAWQKVEMQFKSPETDLVILKLLRDPPGDQLRGSLWLDDVSVQPRR
jgi:hypothetical protein